MATIPVRARNLAVGAYIAEWLRVTAPAAPSAALASPAAPGNVENGAHSYKVTFETADGETEASAVSNTVTVVNKTINGKVLVTIPVSTNHRVTARKVYRSAAGDAVTGPWKLVNTVADNTATTFLDNVADGSLTDEAPDANSSGLSANGDLGAANVDPAAHVKTVQVTGDLDGNTLTMQGSNDGITWFTCTDQAGADVAFTSAGGKVIAENPTYVRPKISAGSGASDIAVSMVCAFVGRHANLA
jgi:hypothetical protein